MNITGFSNVRSSEYMILNDLYCKIKSNCNIFYPFIYQKRRDDTILSLMNNVDNLQVVACFARRPKTDSVLSPKTIITFRHSMFEQAYFLKKYNIPVLAASPIGTGIKYIGFGSKCQWFQIDTGIMSYYEEYKLYNGQIISNDLADGINLVEKNEIDKILLSVPKQSWTEIIEKIQDWDVAYSNYYFTYHSRNLFNSVSGLKPIFIMYQFNNT
ncbi:MAG: hypothetical protein ACYDG2_23405 [Ruminiclostridium sp.]